MTDKRKLTTMLVAGILCALPVWGQSERIDPQGYIYGTIETTNDNRYTGFMRWGTEEAFWDDLFNATKKDLPYGDKRSRKDKDGRIKIFGRTIRYGWDGGSSRQFITRFGDIAEILPMRGDRFEIVMKGGESLRLDGGSNDVGARITIQDESLGDVQIEWEKIDRITFAAAPAGATPTAWRLHGTLTTRHETFEGYIQWDSQENLSTDKLDGDTEDGELSIQMGKIRSIEKNNRDGSWVELRDGRRFLLTDSNDVDHTLRGVFVEDERYGRVEVSWEAFERVDFGEPGKSGRGYDDYGPSRPIVGTVTDPEGSKYTGRLVFDLDEQSQFEMLNGTRHDVEYYIPFGMLKSIQPGRRDSCDVVLKNGTTLHLSDGQDVSERNDGVVVIRDGSEREVYLRWRDVDRIDFE